MGRRPPHVAEARYGLPAQPKARRGAIPGSPCSARGPCRHLKAGGGIVLGGYDRKTQPTPPRSSRPRPGPMPVPAIHPVVFGGKSGRRGVQMVGRQPGGGSPLRASWAPQSTAEAASPGKPLPGLGAILPPEDRRRDRPGGATERHHQPQHDTPTLKPSPDPG